ncbi:hypothetical protein [Nibrella viscosa]
MHEVVGRPASDGFPEDRINGTFDRFAEVAETGVPQRYKMVWRPNGQ